MTFGIGQGNDTTQGIVSKMKNGFQPLLPKLLI